MNDPAFPTKSGAGPTDAALVVAARAGESWAQEALFVRYGKYVLGLSHRLLAHPAEAEDLAQDAFVQAFTRLDSLKNPQAFAAWLGRIVVHTAHKRLRRRRLLARLGLARAEPTDPDALVSPNAPADVASDLKRLYAVLNELGAEERIALVLRRVEGLGLSEIAEQMDVSLATVKRRLVAAEARLNELRDRF
ncbi:MAG TPA: sigma-70 family RNA polymerase sigma factor [Polyangiaceae bacterium]